MKTLSLAVLIAAGGLVITTAPDAEAVPCRYRGWTHVVQHANGNVAADSRYHVLQGEAPTCATNGSSRDTDSTWQDRQRTIDQDRHGLDYP